MSYSISISGHADTVEDEDALVAALEGVIGDGTTYGITSAQGFFQFAGTVDLLPTAPVDDPKADLDVAVTDLDDLLAEKLVPGADGTITISSDDATAITNAIAAVQSEVAAYEASVSTLVASSGNSSSGSSDGSAASSPQPSASAPSTSPTGTGTADAPTLSTGEAVAL